MPPKSGRSNIEPHYHKNTYLNVEISFTSKCYAAKTASTETVLGFVTAIDDVIYIPDEDADARERVGRRSFCENVVVDTSCLFCIIYCSRLSRPIGI